MQEGLRPRPFAEAAIVAAGLVLSAPFIGYVRSWIRTTFPGQFAHIIGGLIVVLAAGALATALFRIRDRRVARYSAIAAALFIAVLYGLASATGNPDVDVVERFHFVEYGLITFLFYRAWKPLGDGSVLVLPILAGILVGIGDEALQWFIPARIGEIADIFLNMVAIGCGLLVSLAADPPRTTEFAFKPRSLVYIGRLAAAVVIAAGLFTHTVHLGYNIDDGEIGTFKSRYTQARLGALSYLKAIEWRTHPLPLTLRRASREDQYMSEGVTHVAERNRMWHAGDIDAAWRENRILEKYYSPVLDTPSYVSPSGHRWPEGQRNDAERRVEHSSRAYVSAANPSPIYTWPKWIFWAVVLAAARAVLVVTSRRESRLSR